MDQTRRRFVLSSLGVGSAAAIGHTLRLSADRTKSSNPSKMVSIVSLYQDPKLSCFEVNLAKCRGGELIATFGRAPEGFETGEILLVRSNEDGGSWQQCKPVAVFSHPGPQESAHGCQLAGMTSLRDGALIACTTKFRFLFEGKVGWRRGSEIDGVYVRRSSDGGHHWGDIHQVNLTPYRLAWTRGAIVEMLDGSLLLPLAGQKGDRYKEVDVPLESFLLRSVDGGNSWEYHSTIAKDSSGTRDYDEPVIVSLGKHHVLCMLRSHESPKRDPLGGYLYVTVSDDGGASWSPVEKTNLWGHPANLIRLQDGRILCTYGYRTHPDPGVRGCVSQDGLTWNPQDIFTIKALPDLDSDRMQIGSPNSVQLDDGRILTAYQVWTKTKELEERLCLEGSLYRV